MNAETRITTHAARLEASHLFKMLEKSGRTPEAIADMRALISPAPGSNNLMSAYRRSVLHFFDKLVSGNERPAVKKTTDGRAKRRVRRRREIATGRKPMFDADRIAKARLAVNAGCRWADVAQRFGASIQTLRRCGVKRKKVSVRKKKMPRAPFTSWRAWSVNPCQLQTHPSSSPKNL
jgi:hypothetical protein